MVCLNCGKFNGDDGYCAECGAELTSPPASIAPPNGGAQSLDAVSPFSASSALSGITLDDRYYLESQIGADEMGTVYRAIHLLIGDWVAVKVLNQDQMYDSLSVERFRREAQIAARLKHPNAVTVYDYGFSHEGINYLVMDLVEGEYLGSLIERQGALAETDAVEIIRQVCAALEEAHSQGVVHSDINPENIVVQMSPEGLQVKVLDFGVAASREVTGDRLTRTGVIVGRPDYMSPEQCLGEQLDGRSDIYSLGVVLFEMLTGFTPFDSPAPTAIVIKHVNDAPPPPRALNPNISPSVESLVLRALEKRREARPQTAGEMARELIAATADVGLSSPYPTMIEPTEVIAPAPTTTALSEEMDAFESSYGATELLDDASVFDETISKKKSSGNYVLLVIVALLLLAGGGLWRYLNNNGNEKAAATNDSAGSGGQTSAVGGQSAATLPHSTSPASGALIARGNLWELISDQTAGVANAVNALGTVDRRMAIINPGGQLALDYRGDKFFENGQGADLIVYGPERGQVSYLIFVRNDPADNWTRIDINRKGFPRGEAGHDMGHHGIRQARQVMIKNIGKTELRIDAVSVVYKSGSP